jgi:hypothetical protein
LSLGRSFLYAGLSVVCGGGLKLRICFEGSQFRHTLWMMFGRD